MHTSNPLKKTSAIFLLVIMGLLAACQEDALQEIDNEDSSSFVNGEATATLMDVLRGRQARAGTSSQFFPCASFYSTQSGEFSEEYLGDGIWLVANGDSEWHVYEEKPIVLTIKAKAGC